jgi:STAS domain-containing protein
VTYLDSTALGAIVAVRKHQERHGGTVIVINADPRLAKLFQITGLEDVLHVNGSGGENQGWRLGRRQAHGSRTTPSRTCSGNGALRNAVHAASRFS